MNTVPTSKHFPALKTSEVLNKAADIMAERGYVKYERHHWATGAVCALGAIESALGFEDYKRDIVFDIFPSVQVLAAHIPDPKVNDGVNCIPSRKVVDWNNADERTGAEVIATMRAAAACEAAQGR